jgi:sugar lactone lactonase YvrE
MRVRVSARLFAIFIFSSVLAACLSACGGGGGSSSIITPPITPPVTTKGYAVADTMNNRVLIFTAQFSTNQGASAVLGQADSSHGAANQGNGTPGANTLNMPIGVAVDGSGNFYVGDGTNGRVLQFKPPFTSNMDASVVFGESGMTTGYGGNQGTSATASGLSAPYLYMAIDSQGDLWVSDYANSRVVEYSPPFSNGMAATLAIGQTTTGALPANTCNQGAGGGANPTAKTLCHPDGITFDASGNLWVADADNQRVLEFKPPFATDMAASLEVGQPAANAFTTNLVDPGNAVSASSLYAPNDAVFDSTGNLWVTDTGNARVLMFAPPFSNGMNATLELADPPGSSQFTTRNAWLTQSGMNAPISLSFDTEGDIFVTDQQYHRVLIFDPPFTNGMDATTVLGQADFISGTANQGGSIGPKTLNSPYGGVTF